MRSGVLIFVFVLLVLPFCFADSSSEGVYVDSAFVKLLVKEGDNVTKELRVKAYSDSSFDVRIEGIDFAFVDFASLEFNGEEEKNLGIVFESYDKAPGIYLGKVVISGKDYLEVPIILEIESEGILFDSTFSVSPNYVNVYPGENMVVENKIFNLENIGEKSVEVDYLVSDFSGKVIFSDKEFVLVESQFLNAKTIAIPEDVASGNYVVSSSVKYEDLVSTSTYFFRINDIEDSSFDGYFVWIIASLFFILILFVFYYTWKKDDVFMKLQSQYKKELESNISKMKKDRDSISEIDSKKRKVKIRQIKEKHKKDVEKIKKIYHKRIESIKKLNKDKKENEIKKKLSRWAREGYNVDEIGVKEDDSNFKSLKYKKEGYRL